MAERLKWGPMAVDPNTGRLATLTQDSDEEITQALEAVLRHRVGDRSDLPGLGVPDPTFEELPIDLSATRLALEEYELRATAVLAGGDELIEDLVAEIRATWTRTPTAEEDLA